MCFSSDPPPKAVWLSPAEADAPMGAYPFPLVADKGKRFVVKSKAEETEYDRLCAPGRPARLLLSRGSSCSRDSFRDEEMPDGDERESVEVRPSGEEDAREASSRESRP